MQRGPIDSPLVAPTIVVDGAASDEELSALLREVYVDGGFTAPDVAEKLFAGPAVRARGTLVTARDPQGGALLGMIVLVPPGSAVRQIAHETEAELQLLAVQPRVRRRRIAHTLVQATIALAAEKRYAGLVLSTQESMTAAHAVYAGASLERTPARDWNRAGRVFYAYQLAGMAKAAH